MVPPERTLLGSFLERLRARAPLLARYRENPALFFSERGVHFFPEFERLYRDLYSLKVNKAVVLAPRGGGKTFGAAVLASSFFLFRDFDVGIVAGSETQALTLFSYISEWLELEETQDAVDRLRRSDLVGIHGNRIVARTASARSIRGLHLGRGKRGALLIIDEEVEADEDVVRAARYTVRTARPALILRSSTYHKLSGSFARLVEDYSSQGYELYRWSSFDIAKPCPYECNSCPVSQFQERYCKGRAKSSNGWIDISEIAGEWQDTNRETFEVEVMGMRPASAGLVIDPGAIERAIVKTAELSEFEKSVCHGDGGRRAVCYGGCYGIDWGFAGMTAVVVLGISGDTVHVLHTQAFSRQGIDAIIEHLKELRERFGLREVYADSSHPFENSRLRDEGFAVWGPSPESLGVSFASFKEEGVSILSWLFEKGRILIPERYSALIRQLRTWRRDAQGHIVKKDDHFPDALVAAMMKLKQMGVGGGRKLNLYTTSKRRFVTR